jgi:ubiquinone/menaquinone biosynthesis C-methylase UbiE
MKAFMHGRRKYHDEAERRQWQEPEPILKAIGMGPGKKLADIGCGSGFFALPAARMAGKDGAVYGVDPDIEALRELRAKAEKEGLTNIFLTAGDAEGIVPCEGCADIVFFGICLHDFHDAGQVLTNAKRILKKGGLLVDLDWKKKPTSRGPPLEIRFDEAKASALIRAADFAIESVNDSGPDHYLILARPL